MSWWEHRKAGSVSWSMVSLVACLVGTLALGLSYWVPAWLAKGLPVIVAPGLLTVDEAAQADVPLGDGYHVLVNDSGLRVARSSLPLLDTATRGSLLSVLSGTLDGREERIDQSLSNLRLTSVIVGNRTGQWFGTVYGPQGESGPHVPVTITVVRTGGLVRIAIDVRGGDAVSLHLDPRPGTIGIPPALPVKNLRRHAWWVSGTNPYLYTNALGARIGVATKGTRVVDLRPDGLLDIHAWADDLVLTVSSTDRPVADS